MVHRACRSYSCYFINGSKGEWTNFANNLQASIFTLKHARAPLIDESSEESPLTVEYPGTGVIRINAATRVAIKRYNHAVTWATRHFISLISIRKKYESNFKEISKLHLLVVIYECTSGQRKHSKYSFRFALKEVTRRCIRAVSLMLNTSVNRNSIMTGHLIGSCQSI